MEDLAFSKKKNKYVLLSMVDMDNFELAYPIFKKANVPFTIYITTSFPDQKGYLWCWF